MITFRRRKRGQGIFDFYKPIASLVNKAMEVKDVIGKVTSDVVNIGQNTREIIREIKKSTPQRDTVMRINRLRTEGVSGSGFAYI
jgi:hypothetical protein